MCEYDNDVNSRSNVIRLSSLIEQSLVRALPDYAILGRLTHHKFRPQLGGNPMVSLFCEMGKADS